MPAPHRLAAWLLGALCLPQTAATQPWSTSAPPPSESALAALERAVTARANQEAIAHQRRLRPFVSLGVAVQRVATRSDQGLSLQRQPGAAPTLALGLRSGFGALFEALLLLDVAAPYTVTAFPGTLAAAAATQPCEGTRRFDLPAGSSLDVTLSAMLRARLLRPSLPFYVGLGVRLSSAVASVRGVATAWCVGSAAQPPPRAEVDRLTWTTHIEAALETGYRFGAREAWDVGLRMFVTDLGRNDARVGGAQWFVAWHFR